MTFFQHVIKIHSVIKYAGQFMSVANIEDALFLAIRFGIKSEIIGGWLYCFTTPLIGCQLETVGFWFSEKHRAYVYSGFPKEGLADEESLDEIRSRLGSEKVRVK
jgi:hypothetical protein